MDTQFNVVYTGLQEGVTADEFMVDFCAKFGISAEKAQKIVDSATDVVVKKAQPEAKAVKYQTAFENCGMRIRLDKIDEAASASAALSLEPMDNKDKKNSDDSIDNTHSDQPKCPKCGSDEIVEDQCQSCGIYISKYLESKNNITIIEDEQDVQEETQQFDASNVSNPYEPPQAPLARNSVSKEGQGSLQGGINGDYDFTIGDIFRESWEKTAGVKGPFLAAWGIYMLVSIVISFVLYFIGLGQSPVGSLINIPALYPIMAGITLMGIHHAVGADISAKSVLNHYKRVLPISLLSILMILLIMLGMLLLVLPGIYLAIAYAMALPLLMDREMSVWQSLESSRKAITKHWFKIFAIYFLLGILILLAMIPMGLGLIWVLPLASILQGVMYKYIFGVESVE